MTYILAIDQSTSATKALLYDKQGVCHARVSRDHQQIYPKPGWVEHDLEEIWQNLLQVVGDIIGRHQDKVGELACLSLTNQRETICIFDRSTGRPLHPGIVWQCRRGAEVCDQLETAGHARRVTELTGLRLDTYFSAPKLHWLIKNHPEIKQALESGAAVIGTIDSYLIHRLTAGQVFATDHTNASRTLLFDIQRLCWDNWLCELFDVPMAALPDVQESSATFGETTLEGLLRAPIPICGVMGDSQASLFAQRCFQAGTAKITFGTGSSVLLNIGHQLKYSDHGSVSTIAWVRNGRPTYCFEGIINFSAATIAWLQNQLDMLQSAHQAGSIASRVSDNGGVYLVPAFAGLSAPHWKPEARAAILGLTAHSTREHIVRAAEESIAYQLRDVLDMMNEDAAIPLGVVNADGGPTKDAFLMQFTADILQIDIHVAEIPDCSALGAAMAGMLGIGIYDRLESLMQLPRNTNHFTPQMDASTLRQNVEGWHAAVARVL